MCWVSICFEHFAEKRSGIYDSNRKVTILDKCSNENEIENEFW